MQSNTTTARSHQLRQLPMISVNKTQKPARSGLCPTPGPPKPSSPQSPGTQKQRTRMANNNIPASAYTVFERIPFMAASHRLPRSRSCDRPVRLRGGGTGAKHPLESEQRRRQVMVMTAMTPPAAGSSRQETRGHLLTSGGRRRVLCRVNSGHCCSVDLCEETWDGCGD